MGFLKRLFGGAPKPASIAPIVPKLSSPAEKAPAPSVTRCRECGSTRFIIEGGERWCAQCRLIWPSQPASPPQKQEPVVASPEPSSTPAAPKPVRYRDLTFEIEGEYSLVCDDKKIVRGIWYRDRSSIKNAARNRMVVATASVNGFTVLDSDYETTIVGGIGGVEDLQNPGGAILWFDSTRELFGK